MNHDTSFLEEEKKQRFSRKKQARSLPFTPRYRNSREIKVYYCYLHVKEKKSDTYLGALSS